MGITPTLIHCVVFGLFSGLALAAYMWLVCDIREWRSLAGTTLFITVFVPGAYVAATCSDWLKPKSVVHTAEPVRHGQPVRYVQPVLLQPTAPFRMSHADEQPAWMEGAE